MVDIEKELKRIHDRCGHDDHVSIEAHLDGDMFFFTASIQWMTTYDDEKGMNVHYADTDMKVCGDDLAIVLRKLDELMTLHLEHEKEE